MDNYSRETVLLTGLAVALVVLILGAIFYNETPQVVSVNRSVQANLTDQTLQQIKTIIQDENIPLSEKLTLLADYIVAIQQTLNTIQQEINTTEMLTIYKQILNYLFMMLGPTISDKLEKAVVLEDYIIHVIQNVEAGDVLAPHLWDWYFDGVDDYLVVGLQPDGSGNPFTVYGWGGITITECVNLIHPKPNSAFSKTGMYGDHWFDRIATYYNFENSTNYTWSIVETQTKRQDNIIRWLSVSVYSYRNTFTYITRQVTDTEVIYYINTAKTTYAIDPNDITILEVNPGTATYPVRYRRFVLGASTLLNEWMRLYQSFLIIHSRALSDTEIQTIYNAKIVNASSLEIFIDPTFTLDNVNYFNLGRYNTTVRAYNGVSRINANETWIWILKNATSDPGVWLRFFPENTIIVYRTGEIDRIASTEYYTNRTDIMLVMIPKNY